MFMGASCAQWGHECPGLPQIAMREGIEIITAIACTISIAASGFAIMLISGLSLLRYPSPLERRRGHQGGKLPVFTGPH